MIKNHGIILILCSIVGFTGHYLQFGVARITPWIPVAIGLSIILANWRFKTNSGFKRYLPLLMVVVFGILTTMMCIKFLAQDVPPLRKKLIFCLMSISAWVTVAGRLRVLLKENNNQRETDRFDTAWYL